MNKTHGRTVNKKSSTKEYLAWKREWSKKWRENNKEHSREYMKKYKETHPIVKARATYLAALRSAKKKVEKAGRIKPEICEICGEKGKIVFDHDHKTGNFRGWICHHCNIALGGARDDTEILYKLVSYLREHAS